MSRKTFQLLLALAACCAAQGATARRAHAIVVVPAAAANDVWIRQSNPTTVYQGDLMSTWSTQGPPDTARYGMVQFSLAGIGTPITSATIQLNSRGGSATASVVGAATAVNLAPAFWVDSSTLPGDLSAMNWDTYISSVQPSQQAFTTLGGANLAAGDVRPGTYATLGNASAADLTALNNIRLAGGSITMIYQATSGQQDWGDTEVSATPARLVINQAAVESDNLTLTVNRITGATSISNPAKTTSFSLDGYQITSAAGSLVPDATHTNGVGWDSLANAGKPGWQEVNPSANALAELNLSSSTAIAAGASQTLGKGFTPFGTEDLQFQYSLPNGTFAGNGFVKYTGGLQVVVHTLTNNHGAAVENVRAVLNNPETAAITTDGYTIKSASGSLNPGGFNGFAGHSVSGWQSVGPTVNALSELNLTSSTAIPAQRGQALLGAFTAGATKDLTFEYNIVGHGIFTGEVIYITSVSGDANLDGVVNGQDISLVASNWLHNFVGPGDANYDGVVNGQDIALVASHWLNTSAPSSGSGQQLAAVPEPSSLALLVLGAAIGGGRWHRRRRHQQ